jgi:hypothetical protein
MQQQQMAQQAKQLGLAKQMIEGVARAWTDTDPKRAADLLQILAKLTKAIPQAGGPPTNAAGVMGMAQGLPPGGGAPPMAMPPPNAGRPMGPPGMG